MGPPCAFREAHCGSARHPRQDFEAQEVTRYAIPTVKGVPESPPEDVVRGSRAPLQRLSGQRPTAMRPTGLWPTGQRPTGPGQSAAGQSATGQFWPFKAKPRCVYDLQQILPEHCGAHCLNLLRHGGLAQPLLVKTKRRTKTDTSGLPAKAIGQWARMKLRKTTCYSSSPRTGRTKE